ncbi:MAG: hypothetical protein ABIW84_02590 [Ilumatobacteraceae bacterium]
MTPPQRWIDEHFSGSAQELHDREMPAVIKPAAWWLEVDDAALVLGSSQPIAHIDQDACRKANIDVVRRRSGGGAVLLIPGDVVWVDVLIPAGAQHWTADVSSSAGWLGEVWIKTLAAVGVHGLTVHPGPLVRTQWSQHVCFAGVGGGEVVRRCVDPEGKTVVTKVVGISQRRTRSGARFQCALHRQWRPAAHEALFVQPGPTTADLTNVAGEVYVAALDIRGAFMSALEHSSDD